MKVKGLLTTTIALALLALSACRGEPQAPAATDDPGAAPAAAPVPADPLSPPPAINDAPATAGSPAQRAVLGLLNAINDHEIAAGQQALSKGVQGRVADFARLMVDQHAENRQKTDALGADTASPEAAAQREAGRKELDELATKNGAEYQAAYVDAMVKGHAEALEALDTRIIPAAESEAAKAHLAETRQHVAEHLRLAQEIQASGG